MTPLVAPAPALAARAVPETVLDERVAALVEALAEGAPCLSASLNRLAALRS